MGFGSIDNSLAIAFDTWTNPGQDALFKDHISVQSLGKQPNDAFEKGLLGTPKACNLADGKIHMARITYYNELKPQYFSQLVASQSLVSYLKDNGEQKRIGTLVVYLDDGIISDTPILTLPINLSLLLDMEDDSAYVGFTSSTGRFYEKHDIISWWYCDQEPFPCSFDSKTEFDYFSTSKKFTSNIQDFEPGQGFGGGENTHGFPIKNEDPDASAIGIDAEILLSGNDVVNNRQIGLDEEANKFVPPNTLY